MTFKSEFAASKARTTDFIEQPVKVEVVNAGQSFSRSLFHGLFALAFRVLVVWWAVASFFPELGLTYWQLVLPVYAFRVLVTGPVTKRNFRVKNWRLQVRKPVQWV